MLAVQVSVDTERCSPGGRILEHSISLQNPLVSGIRVDAVQLCSLALPYLSSAEAGSKPLRDTLEGKWLLDKLPNQPTLLLNVYAKEVCASSCQLSLSHSNLFCLP